MHRAIQRENVSRFGTRAASNIGLNGTRAKRRSESAAHTILVLNDLAHRLNNRRLDHLRDRDDVGAWRNTTDVLAARLCRCPDGRHRHRWRILRWDGQQAGAGRRNLPGRKFAGLFDCIEQWLQGCAVAPWKRSHPGGLREAVLNDGGLAWRLRYSSRRTRAR